MNVSCREIARMIDHSLLKPNLAEADIRAGCAVALKYGVASVCVGPAWVPLVRGLLAGSDVKVGTVIGFPHGYQATEVKAFEAAWAVREGAEELDMVANVSRLLSRDYAFVEADVRAVVEAAHPAGAIVKVILENCYLTDELKREGCRIAERAGADFVKTSTGFGPGGATFADLRLMRASVSPRVRVKAAGGIRELETALLVREAGGARFGCTTTEALMEECRRRHGG